MPNHIINHLDQVRSETLQIVKGLRGPVAP